MSRASSDQAYLLDLCDEVLGEASLRQHRFEFAWEICLAAHLVTRGVREVHRLPGRPQVDAAVVA